MENRAVPPNQFREIDDVFDADEPGVASLINGIIYWGLLGLGFAIPIAGAVWGAIR